MPRYSTNPTLPGGSDPILFGAWDGPVKVSDPGRDQVYLGRLNEAGARRKTYFDITRETVLAVFGKRGSGKSYTLGVLAEAICTIDSTSDIGYLTRSRGGLLIDTLNVFWSLANPFKGGLDERRFATEMSSLTQWGI